MVRGTEIVQSVCSLTVYTDVIYQTIAHFYLVLIFTGYVLFRLRLADILVQPMQRLTKYSLLLRAIKKPMADEANLLVNMKAMVSLCRKKQIYC